MPQGWEEADWKALPAAAQTRIAQSEQAHAAALSREIEARQAMAAEKERFTADVNREVSLALSTMQQIVEGEFSQIDWKQLAETDPKTYVQLQQAYDARMASIRQIQQNLGVRVQQMQQERAAAAERAMHAERDKVLPELAAMFGSGFDGRKFGEAARNYLRAQGVPETAVAAMSQGYEVKMVAKAMLYDYQAAQRAKAQQKVAEAPRVSSAGKTAPADGSARLKKALARLNSHPRSTDAIADIFEML